MKETQGDKDNDQVAGQKGHKQNRKWIMHMSALFSVIILLENNNLDNKYFILSQFYCQQQNFMRGSLTLNNHKIILKVGTGFIYLCLWLYETPCFRHLISPLCSFRIKKAANIPFGKPGLCSVSQHFESNLKVYFLDNSSSVCLVTDILGDQLVRK